MRILTVEDDPAVAASIELMLMHEKFHVYSTDLGEEGVELARLYDYDCITLDLTLPDMSGYDVIKQIRSAKVKTPIIVLTQASGVEDKVKALDLGADDYLTKPFHKDELIARIFAVVRRSKGIAHNVVSIGDFAIDLNEKTVRYFGAEVPFTGKEWQIFEILAMRKGTTLTKEMLLNHLYGGMDEPDIKIIDVFICKIRKKLAEAGAPNVIETNWGRGYILREPEQASPSIAPEIAEMVAA